MPRNLIIRVGIDASGYSKGLKKVEAETKSVSEKLANETSSVSQRVAASQRVAPAQAGTSVTDRVGSMLKEGGIPLITDIDVNNIAEARRQAEDLAAVMTKLQAKGAGAKDATGPDVEKYWQVKGMYEAITDDIRTYDTALAEQAGAQANAEAEAERLARAENSVLWNLGKIAGDNKTGNFFRGLYNNVEKCRSGFQKFRQVQADSEAEKIGRASCRERVCLYV